MKKTVLFLGVIGASFGAVVMGQEMFNNCGMEGSATTTDEKMQNRLKNRYAIPPPQAYNKAVTFDELMKPGNDIIRFSTMQAAELYGYVYDVRAEEAESCNCNKRDFKFRDTRIELIQNPGNTEGKYRVFVKVTPRIREMMTQKNMDWSTNALRTQILGKFVKIKGWLFFDKEHMYLAENTNPKNKLNTRATCWELHPVVEIEVVNARMGRK